MASCLEAASAFSTVGIGSVTRAKIPARSMTSLRGGAGLTQTKMAGSAHDFKLPLVGGGEKALSDYKGKVVLIENVASL